VTRKRQPSPHHTVTAFLLCRRAAEVIDFLKGAFDAEEVLRIDGPRAKVLHAELRVGDSRVMLGEPSADMPRLKARPAHHYVFVDDVHASYRRALRSGGVSFSKPVGPRLGAVTDPGGNFWWIARREMVDPALIKSRHEAYVKKHAAKQAASR
jgi:PhnB protein